MARACWESISCCKEEVYSRKKGQQLSREASTKRHYLTLEETQHALLELLKAFDEICLAHELRYSICFGTLLGAVRHKGFIPWDNDVDVIMPRPDYERMLMNPEWFGNLLVGSRQSSAVEGYFLPFAKVYDPRWHVQEAVFTGRFEEYLWLDVFPFDAVPDDDARAEALLKKQRQLYMQGKWSVQNVDAVTRSRVKRFVKKVVLPLHRVVFPYDKVYEKMEQNAKRYSWGSTNRVGFVVWGPMPAAWLEPSEFDKLERIEFAGCQFMAFQHRDKYLHDYYGDYMTLPPESKRLVHNYQIWSNEND